MSFRTNGSGEDMRLTSGGNLLLGTTFDFSAKLQVVSNTNPQLLISGNSGAGIYFIDTDTSQEDYQIIVGANDMVFRRVSDTSDRIRLYGTTGNIVLAPSSGNVGIGTSSPSEKVTISGANTNTLKITPSDSETTYFTTLTNNLSAGLGTELKAGIYNILTHGLGTGTAINFTNSSLKFNFRDVEKARITDGGNLLLATTTDSGEKLVVNGNAKFADQVTIPATPVASTDAASKSYVDAQVSATDSLQEVTTIGNTTTNSIMIGSSSSPSRPLHVVNTSAQTVAVFDGGNNSAGEIGFMGNGTGGDTYVTIGAVANDMSFSAGANERMRLTSDGKLGIGLTNPISALDVNGTISLSNNSENKLYNASTSPANGTTTNTTVLYGRQIDLYALDDIVFRTGTSSNDDIIFFAGNSEKARMKGNGNLLLGTTSDSGYKLQVNGDIQIGDNDMLRLGDSSDLKLYHTGTGTVIQNAVGNLTIQQDQNDGDIIFRCDDGTGGTTEYFRLDGGYSSPFTIFPDGSNLAIGSGLDLRISHSGTDSFIDQTGTGDLYIRQKNDGKDIILQSDDGTGGTASYITLDGSQTTINLQKTVLIGTTTNTGAYKIDVAGKQRVQDTLELDDVLMLNAISTPSDPAAGKSVIYMDSSDGGIKCKINVGGTVVTRTIASFE
jgi:hypothetical protein